MPSVSTTSGFSAPTWNNRFHLQFPSAEFQEYEPPTPTSIVTPDDGYAWSPTRVVFPEYQLSEIKRDGVNIPEKMYAVMYQRMGFYVAPHGRLLARGFHVFAENPPQSPNAGDGFGRVVREVRAAPPACWIDDLRTR